MAEQASKKAMAMPLITISYTRSASHSSKGLALRVLVGILLTVVHLLLERLRLFLVTER